MWATSMNNLLKILGKMKNKKVLVIGDIMLDKYIWGEVKRISPEAPVQIVNVTKESFMPGGAGNAANNIAALEGIPYLISIVGNDVAKDMLIEKLKEEHVIIEGVILDKDIPTIQKIRIMAKSQQLLRIDYEKKIRVSNDKELEILKYIKTIINDIDIILISDYSKGMITKSLMNKISEISEEYGKRVIIDPKPKNKDCYGNCYLITPNISEAVELSGSNDNDIDKIGKILLAEMNCNVLITRGEDGMSLFEKTGDKIGIPTKAKEVYDVSGAGDTTVAALSLAIAAGASLKEASLIANYAAGIAVGKIGTSTVSLKEIEESIKNDR